MTDDVESKSSPDPAIKIAVISAGATVLVAMITTIGAVAGGWLQYRGPGSQDDGSSTETVDGSTAIGDEGPGPSSTEPDKTAASDPSTTSTSSTVEAIPLITVVPDETVEREAFSIQVSGSGFGSGERVRIGLSDLESLRICAGCTFLKDVEADEAGSFQDVSITVNGSDSHVFYPRSVFVFAMGEATERSAVQPFRVLESPPP